MQEQYYHKDHFRAEGDVIKSPSASEILLRDSLIKLLRDSGIEVIDDVEEGQRVLAAGNTFIIKQMTAKQKRALETVSFSQDESYHQTVISSAYGAKILNNLDTLVKEYENSIHTKEKTFIGALAEKLEAHKHGSNSEYASFETMNGRVITIRLANHNAKVSTFDNHGENEGISIVVTPKDNNKLTNDGTAHVTEFYYNALKLRRADGQPLADIVRSIKQALYSGVFKDTTGLVERQEVNVDNIVRYQKAYHGSAKDFDVFDLSHMGEGEGVQAHGWGTYVTKSEGVGRKYATKSNKATGLKRSELDSNINRAEQQLPYLHGDVKAEKEKEIKVWKDELSKLDDSKLLYTVEIPDDTGNNYIEEKQTLQDLNHPDMAGRIDKVMDDYLGAKDFWNSWQTPGWAMREEFIRMAMGQHPEMSRGDAERKYSELLSKAGVVGVHYNGRKDGDCYVIFDDNDLKITDKVKFFQTPNGDTYGYALGGKIYIDPKIATAETPIHEYAHLWSEVLRKGNPEEWKNVVGLMKQETVIWDDVKKNYPHLESDDDIADEVLATYSGRQGAKKLRAIRDGIVDSEDTVANKRVALSSLERFRQLLSRLWKDIVDLLHIHFTTAEDVADKVMYDLLNGVNPEKIQVPSQLGSSIADRNDYVDASTDEVTVYPKRIKEWLSKESIDRARGKSKEDIIGMFGNEPVPIAYVPKDYLYVLGDNVTDNRIYSGKGYFIDHALNHHPQIDVKTYDYMQEVLAHPNDIKTTNNGVAFIKKIDQWNAVVVSVEKAKDGKIIWHKSFYDQKKEIYKNRPSIMKRGLSADATPSINPANKAFGSKRSISALDNPNAKIENISDIDVNKGENLSEGSKISFQFIGEHDSASRDKSPERTTRMDNLHITSEIEAVNRRFNEELDAFKNNTSKGLLHLGSPSSILRACGVDVMELTLSPSVLHQHLKKHGLKTDDLKGLVKGLQTPMLVYKHGLNVPNIVVVTELNSPKGKLSVALRLNPYGKVVEMSNISSIHGKDVTMEIDRLYTLGETLRKALRYVDKEKVSSWMMSSPYMEAGTSGNQKLFSVAKIINDFENPVKKDENLSNDPKIRFQFIGKHGTDIDNKSQITMKTPTQPLLSPLYHAMEYSRMHDGMWLLPNDKELPVSSSPYDDLMTMFKIKANESDTHMKLMSERIQLEQSLPSSKKIYFDALSLSRKVGKSEGFRVEMYLKTLESHYDTKNDKIKYTMIPTEDLTHMPRFLVASRANDLYRAVVAATGSSSRLDRSHRDLLPDDAAAHEALVRDIAASVLMSRQGLPATLSKEVKDKLDYYERELKENPSYESTLKQDVDTTIKVIEMAVKEERVDFRDFRRSRQNAFDPHTHSIVQALATFPNAESREIVVVKDEGAGKADVILPQGASLEVWNEAPCLHKEDITEALSKQGIDNVRYFNANGSLRLRETNDYFKDKDVFLANYSKHSLNVKKSLDFTKAIRKTNDKVIEKFRCIKDDTGKYAFFLKPEGESSFSIYPTKEQRNRYFMSANEEKTDRDKIRYDISQEAYRYARDHPAEKHELIMPRVSPGIDMSRISHARLTRDARSGNTYIKAEIDGVAHTQKISNEQWSRLWLADDMKNYKISLAAHVFASVLIKSEGQVTASAPSVQADEVRIHSDAIDNSQEQDEEEVRRPVFHL